MSKRSDVIHLSPGQGRHEESVIDLASPQHAVDLCNQAGIEVDSNNFSAQLQGLSSSQEAADGQDYHRQHEQERSVATARKRVFGEMTGTEPQQQGQSAEQPHCHHQRQRPRVAHQMQWGTTGPRMQRSRVTVGPPLHQQPAAGPASEAVAAPSPMQRSVPSRRRLTVVHHRQQAAATTDSAPIVIDDESPTPTARQQQYRGGLNEALTAVSSRPAPLSIQSNPRYSSRSAAAAAAATSVFQHPRQQHGRSRYMRTEIPPEAVALQAAAGYSAPGSSGGGSNDNSGSSCDAELARKVQEQEDAHLARRMMQDEQLQAQREASERHRRRLELMHQIEAEEAVAEAAAAAVAQAASPGHARGRRGGRAPQRAEGQYPAHRPANWGMAMAHALLQLPRWGAAGAGRGRGLPPGLTAMREAMLGMQTAGLPPHMLFTDRDFGADDYEMLLRLDETVEKRGASSNTIEALPTQTVPAGGITGAAGEKLSCPVCLEEFTEGAELRTLPCLHRFDKACIDKWLGVKASCPVCNRECQ